MVFTGISSHWLLNSAIPTWSVKKLAENFDGYLKRREELIEKGVEKPANVDFCWLTLGSGGRREHQPAAVEKP